VCERDELLRSVQQPGDVLAVLFGLAFPLYCMLVASLLPEAGAR
jgi:hypothetical protein